MFEWWPLYSQIMLSFLSSKSNHPFQQWLQQQLRVLHFSIHLSKLHLVGLLQDHTDSKLLDTILCWTAAVRSFDVPLRTNDPIKRKSSNISRKVTTAAASVAVAPAEVKEFVLPSWAEFDLGKAPVYWKTMNGLPPTAGEKLKLFYNPAATNLVPNEEFGIAFNGGFNQPIMCGGEPRAMLMKQRGKADPPIYTIQICIPKHATSLIFSFTNGTEWDGPYRLPFQVPKAWRNRPAQFFSEGLAEELSKEGACDRAIFPDANIVVTRCAMIGNLSVEGGDRCNLDLVPGCIDPSSPFFDPLATVDDGSCPPYTSDSEE